VEAADERLIDFVSKVQKEIVSLEGVMAETARGDTSLV
jgi:hypothetical protein